MATANGNGPDLTQGVTLEDFKGQKVLRGHVGDEAILLVRIGDEVLAVGAHCTHYGGPLAEGAIEGETVRCPWHHACFSLRSGEAVAAPAFDALSCWEVERSGDRLIVRNRRDAASRQLSPADPPQAVVIIGGGAAGFACAEMLRRRGYRGALTMLSADADPPCDRPNLSKDYLAGNAPEEWMPLRDADFYAAQDIDLQLETSVAAINPAARTVTTVAGATIPFDRLLLATGAQPVQPPIPGADQDHVHTLRSFADCRAIIARADQAKSAVVLGSGFIGLEVAAALRARGLAVHVASLDSAPLQGVLGPELAGFVRQQHEANGVTFHLGTSLAEIGTSDVRLSDGQVLPADLIILGIGVRPRVELATAAGLAVDHGILVDAQLQTAVPGIYAAGDVARWSDAATSTPRRIEHWVVAERQGQVVAENMLGAGQPFRDVPFFWSAHYDATIRYAGHGQGWDRTEVDGDPLGGSCLVRYLRDGKLIAVAGVGRDRQVLDAAAELGDA